MHIQVQRQTHSADTQAQRYTKCTDARTHKRTHRVTGRKEDQVLRPHVWLRLPAHLSVAPCGRRALRASLVFVLRVCARVPTTTIYPQTQSFLFLVSRGSGRRESGRGRKGVGREGPGSSAQAPVSSQGQVPARSPGCPREGQDSPRQAAAEAAGVGSLGLIQPPGTWEPVRVTAPGRSGCPAEEPWAGGGFWRLVLFRPQHSCPRVSQFWEPPSQRTSGLVGRGPGSPFPGPGTLREGGAGTKGPGIPPLRWTLPPQLRRPAPDVLSRCAIPLALCSCPSPSPCSFGGNEG